MWEDRKMKARIKATGDIIEISENCSYLYAENYDKSYNLNELEFIDIKEKSFPKDESDYWEKLKHQYAGMFLQGIIIRKAFDKDYVEDAYKYATALVNKLKEESQCKE